MPTSPIKEADAIVLALGCDQNYALPLAVTLYSTLTALSDNPVDIWILDGGMRDNQWKRLERLCARFGSHVRLTRVETSIAQFSEFDLLPHISPAAYLRLLLPQLLPQSVRKVLYLDSDLYVRTDITDLWNSDFERAPLLAVQGFGAPYIGCEWGVSTFKELGLPPDTPCFNSGVLLIDLHRWRHERIAERSVSYLAKFKGSVKMGDQEALNAVLAGDWKMLDPTWNQMHPIYNFDQWEDTPFKRMIAPRLTALLDNPKIVHFTSHRKPWQRSCPHPWAPAFRNCASQTGMLTWWQRISGSWLK